MTTGVELHPGRLDQPLHWRRPRRIFVCSMSDLFHEDVPDEFIWRVLSVAVMAPQHIFQYLTKRPERMLDVMKGWYRRSLRASHPDEEFGWPVRSNIWLGVSVENQYWADRRIPLLLETPAAIRFLSLEPLLKPVDLTRVDYGWKLNAALADFKEWREHVPFGLRDDERVPPGVAWLDVLKGEWFDGWDSGSDGPKVDQVIVGGESGPKNRPLEADWVRDLRDQCVAAGVPLFVKQASHRLPGQQGALPDDLWALKEFPAA
jgi:protein gp37